MKTLIKSILITIFCLTSLTTVTTAETFTIMTEEVYLKQEGFSNLENFTRRVGLDGLLYLMGISEREIRQHYS